MKRVEWNTFLFQFFGRFDSLFYICTWVCMLFFRFILFLDCFGSLSVSFSAFVVRWFAILALWTHTHTHDHAMCIASVADIVSILHTWTFCDVGKHTQQAIKLAFMTKNWKNRRKKKHTTQQQIFTWSECEQWTHYATLSITSDHLFISIY